MTPDERQALRQAQDESWENWQSVKKWKARAEELETELAAERQALEALIAKLDEVHAHPQYKAVWLLAHIHGQNYTGPTYDKELEAAREALGRLPREEKP